MVIAILRMSLICALAVGLLAGCRSADGESGADVVVTTTQAADIARNVAGSRIEVHGILTADADPHDYEPRPSDVEALAHADLVIMSGGEIDEWMDDLIEASGTDAAVVRLLESVGAGSGSDPHWWQDPRHVVAAVEVIEGELSALDPGGESAYAANAEAYARAIQSLDRKVAECMAGVPDEARKLVTAHDSLGYLAARYDIEVVGSAIPALSTQAQPSTGEVAELVGLIQAQDVKAVFPEAGLSAELERAIADEAGVAVGDELYADALGEEGSPGETLLGANRANATALLRAFAGEPVPGCRLGSGR